jgi:23S rRNA pseudouridine2605 synthase
MVIKKRSPDRTYLLVTIREGRNREVRRVFARLGFPVQSLKRIRIASLTLHKLSRGKCRFLAPWEVRELLAAAAATGTGTDPRDPDS